MKILSFFVLIFILKIGEAALSPTCIGASLQYAVKNLGTNTTIYKANFNLNIEMDYSNTMYPNKLTVSNQSYWSIDYSLYNLTNPIWYAQVNSRYGMNCSYFDDCSFNVPNGNGNFILNMRWNATYGVSGNIEFFVDNGNMFDSNSAKLFNPKNYPCSMDEDGSTFCCNEYLYFDIPESNENPCEEFETKAEVVTDGGLTIFKFKANHLLHSDSFDTTVTDFINNVDVYGYEYYSNNIYSRVYNGTYCYGDNDSPYSNCTFLFPSSNADFQRDMIVDMGYYGYLIIGQVIRRNGMYFKNDNISYTPTDPCWNTATPVPSDYQVEKSAVVQASLCCTRFKSGSTIIYPTTTLPTTPSKNCNVSNIIFAGEMSKSISSQQKRDFFNLILRLTSDLQNTRPLKFAITTYGAQIYQPITFQSYPDFVNIIDNLISDLPNPNGAKTYLESVLRDIYNTIISDPSKQKNAVVIMGELQSILDPNAAMKYAQQLKDTGAPIYVLDYSTGDVPTTIWQYITNNLPNRIINGTGNPPMRLEQLFEQFLSNVRWGYC